MMLNDAVERHDMARGLLDRGAYSSPQELLYAVQNLLNRVLDFPAPSNYLFLD